MDFARTQIVYRKDALRGIDSLGVESLAFGSHMPFDYVGPSQTIDGKIGGDAEQVRP